MHLYISCRVSFGPDMLFVNISEVILPLEAVDGNVGVYTCEVCLDRGTPAESCSRSNADLVPSRKNSIMIALE